MSDWIIWVGAGLVLLMLEIHAPGAFMMWLGLAACGTGLIVLVSGIGFELQVITVGVLAAISLTVGLRFRHPRRPPRMNTQQSGLAGRSATALTFQGREGRVRIGDSDWAARVPPDVAEPEVGSRLRVEGVDGTVLIVRPEG
jgi:membrane protein implicated in regulation of membrane protease activity